MANVNYDTLTIEINADSGKATRSINALSKSLLKLEDTSKSLDWEQLKKAKKYLEDIAKINFDNVRQGLQDVVSAFKALNNEAKKGVKPLSEKAQAKAIDLMTNGGQGFGEPKIEFPAFDLSKIAQQTTSFIDFEQKTKQVGELNDGLSVTEARLKGLGFTAEQIENMMSMGQANRDLQEKIALLQSLGLNASQAKDALKGLNKEAGDDKEDSGDRGGNKRMGKLQKLFNSIKRIALYRLIRRVIQIIAKAIKEGIENIAKFDKEFNKSMSNIKSALTYLKNAIGSAFAPIIQMLEPFITGLIMQFAELFNKIGEIASAMQGKDMFTKAKYKAEDFAKTLAKVSLGIDELNVVQQDTGSFEEAEVGEEAKETAETIKGIMSAIKDIVDIIKPIFMTIIKTAKDFIMKILPKIKPLLEAVANILKPIATLIDYLIQNTNDLVNDSIVAVVEAITSILNMLGEIVNGLMPILMPIVKIIAEVINMINQVIIHFANLIKNLIGDLDWLKYIISAIAIVVGVVLNAIATVITILRAVMQIVTDIVNGDFGAIEGHWNDAMENIKTSWSQDFVGAVASTPMAQGYQTTAEAPSVSGGSTTDVGGTTQVTVYIDSEEVASRVNQQNANRGVSTIKRGTLSYGK